MAQPDLLVPGDLTMKECEEILQEIRMIVITGTAGLYELMGPEVAHMTIGEEVVRIYQKHRLIGDVG